ncbi:MAG: signal peptidase I [Clostridia bacterium]|nr:signal peptidase I [Clostridia bacterium]
MEEKVIPSADQIGAELKREKNKIRFKRIIKNTLCTLVVVAAIAVLITTLVLPVLQIAGTSMEPTLENGDIVVLLKTSKLDYGDLCGFSYSNKILIKRVIALPGDTLVIDRDGNVYVNGVMRDEPYVSDKGLGECDIEFPYTVPENTYFLMGDHRSTSIDSRNTVIGCIPTEQIVGKLFFRVWPFSKILFFN